MSSKTRKLIWSVPLMATLAVVGALAVFVALGLPNAGTAEAAPPQSPTIDTSTKAGNQKITVVFYPRDSGGKEITGFTIQAVVASSSTTANFATPAKELTPGAAERSAVITGLSNDLGGSDKYFIRIRATNADGDGSWSPTYPTAGLEPKAVKPDMVQALSVMPGSVATELMVTWDLPADVGGHSGGIRDYMFQVDDVAIMASTSPISLKDCDDSTAGDQDVCNVDSDTRMAIIEGLSANTTYRVEVAANSDGSGDLQYASMTARTMDATSVSGSTVKVEGFSNSPSGKANITLKFTVDGTLPTGSKVVIFLEDDFQVPASIPNSTVFFTSDGTGSGGSPVYTTLIEVDDGDYNHVGDDGWSIAITVPDMDTRSSDERGSSPNRFDKDDVVTLRVTEAAGIKNDSEAGKYAIGYQILTPQEDIKDDVVQPLDQDADDGDEKLVVLAKVALSDENNKRDYELNIVGSGLNSGRTATAYVLMDYDESTMPSCGDVIDDGESVGSAVVGSDHTTVVVDTVTTDNYSAGKTNYICMQDDNSPMRKMTTVKPFEMQASIAASPAEVSSGDEVTVAIRDFRGFDSDMEVTKVSLAGDKVWTPGGDENAFDVDVRASDKELTFEMPGGVSGSVEISVDITVDGESKPTSKQATITVNPSGLMLSKSEVAPNESIVISGSGFSKSAKIFAYMIEIDGKMLDVDEAGTEGTGDNEHVVTTSSGQFTATVNIWHDGAGNPALDADTYTIKITDENGYEGETTITILEPTVMVTPQVAGPRDYILITGANWPVTTSDDDNDVTIMVDDKTRSASIDSTGRFNYEYQLSGGIDIGAEHDIVVSFTTLPDIGGIEETITFSVPSSNVVITPPAAAPGQIIQLELSGMPIYERVNEVVIDGGNRLGGTAVNTDSEGDVTVTGIVIPFADPGFYPVKIVVGTGGSAETAIVQLEILAESSVRGAASSLPEAVMDLGDSVVRIFHFNTRSKVWTFYDPREEFEGLNTLTELAAGQPYSILVSENVENVVLNGRTRDLTCVGGDCWNQLVW